jgi:PAS domain S-box-containing protein
VDLGHAFRLASTEACGLAAPQNRCWHQCHHRVRAAILLVDGAADRRRATDSRDGTLDSRNGDQRLTDGFDALGGFAAILQRVDVPCAFADDDGVFVWVNDAFVGTFGDVRGRAVTEMISPESRVEVEQLLADRLDGEQVAEYVVDALLPDGRRVRTEFSWVRVDSSLFGAAIFGTSVPRGRVTTPHSRLHLTPRQCEVLHLLAVGCTTDQIAGKLHVSIHTVRNHIRQLLQSLRVHSRLEAVAKARREGILAD